MDETGTSSVRPSPVWYLTALGLAVLSWIVGVAVAGDAWDSVRHASISSANQAIRAEGESIAVFTDVVQANRQITCSMIDVIQDADPIPIAPAPIPLTVEDDGTTWSLVAFEPEGRDNVTVACTPKDKRVDNAQYAYATVDGFLKQARIGNFVILGGMLGAVIISSVIFFRRRKSRLAQ